MARKIQLRRGTAATWTSANTVLAEGEIGLETDTGKGKIGDGTTAWNSLEYGLGSGTIHIDIAGEFTEVSEKVTAASADKFLIEDSAAGGAKKYIQATNLPAGVDTTAIHKATASEISAITLKASPVSADMLLIEDSADSNSKKRVTIGTLPTGVDSTAIHKAVNAEISVITEKSSPISGDVLLIEDSAASYAKKRLLIGNLPGGVDTTAIHKATAAEISAITEKTAPIAADLVLIEDSAASNAKRRSTLSNLAKGIIPRFSVTKNTNFSTTSTNPTYIDVVTWDTPTVNTAGITVNSGVGTFTFTQSGLYEISYCLTNLQTSGANRNTAYHRLVLDGTLIKGTLQHTYNRNTTDGSSSVSAEVCINVSAGQVLKLQTCNRLNYTQTILADSCVINIKRVG